MKTYRTLFGNTISEMELTDFQIGNYVKYDGNGSAPKYLAEYVDLYVEKINIKTVRVVSKSFPNEHWNIPPVYLKKVN
ncbi:MAG: hypothetical protein PHY47_26500 [Lachnospiraceae bacterium]|nr:hypothetical protein [Lachnospiraceae bacterium]